MMQRQSSDSSELMDLAQGTLKRLVFSPPREVDSPTYKVVANVERFDMRDHVHARMLLEPGTTEYDDYYSRHPEKKGVDDERRQLRDQSGKKRIARDPLGGQASVASFYGAFALSPPRTIDAALKAPPIPAGRVAIERVDTDPQKMSRTIKALGLQLGAAKVRITRLNQDWVFTNQTVPYYGKRVDLDYPNVICFATWQSPFMIKNLTGLGTSWEIGWHYSYGSLITIIIANYIRHLGWRARPLPTFNSPYLVVPTFVDAGMGEQGRCGYVVSKDIGNNWRPGAVATDIPLATDKPVDFGLQDFCERCGICAERCPSGAIPRGGKQVVRGVRKWQIDADACMTYWARNGGPCAICQAVCPWNHPNTLFHKGMREIAQRSAFLRKTLVAAEKAFYGKRQAAPDPAWMRNTA